MKEQRVEKILAVSFTGVAVLLVIIALVCAMFSVRTQKTSEKLTGTITELRGRGIEVSYIYNGRQYEAYVSEYSSSMREGDDVILYVSKDNPEKVRTEMLLFLPTLILSIVGAPFFIVGGIFFLFVGIKGRKKKALLQNGRVVEATVTGGQMNYSMSVNGRHPWKLECKYEDTYTGATYLYSSYNIWKDPFLYIGQIVKVYVDRENPRKYYVDVDSLFNGQQDNKVFDYR